MTQFTENAIQILEKRYLKTDDQGSIIETIEDRFKCVAEYVASCEENKDRELYAWQFYEIMTKQEFLPNSPTIRNAGANKGSLSACFYLDIEDSRKSIFGVLSKSVEIQAFGGGTGHNFSQLRGEGSLISTTRGKSSGPIIFMKVFNFVIGEVIQQGGVRHGAQMGLLDIDHPDIEKFITCKKTEGDLNNFNISITMSDKFMECLDRKKYDIGFSWSLRFNGGVVEEVNGLNLWNKIITGAWENGEPGILFIDTVNKLSPTYPYQVMRGCNPCGEQILGNMESCNLGSINLSKFVKTYKTVSSLALINDYPIFTTEIDWKHLREVVRTAVRFLDNVIDVNNYPIPEIETETKKFRKIGLGVMGWADMLIKLKISYNSPEALELAEKVMKFINDEAVKYSEELLQEKGHGTWEGFLDPAIYAHDRLNPLFKRRNATLTTIAPTGTLSIVANCSSGIEPVFSFEFKKKCIDKEIIVKHPLYEEWEKGVNYQLPYDKPKFFVESKDVPIEQHVRMQAAFQKHVHNAVSKTINAPNSATIEDVDRAFKLAWELGCKGITFYRDGSREFQAQTAVRGIKLDNPTFVDHISESKPAKMPELVTQEEREQSVIEAFSDKYEGTLEPPEWMLGGRQLIKTGEGTLWVHLFEDPISGYKEVWAQISKEGRTISSMNAGLGRLATLALNRGATWDEVVKQLRGIVGERTAWFNGEQVMSPPDGIAKVIKRRVVDSKDWPVCQCSSTVEQLSCKQPVGGSIPLAGSKNADLCPECASILIHDEGCKGGRCNSCGWSNCS